MSDLRKTFQAVMDAQSWMGKANCKNMSTDLFFSTNNNYDPFVREVCASCPVIEECLWYANETSSDHGFMGGMSPTQRQLWRRRNGIVLGMSRSEWSNP